MSLLQVRKLVVAYGEIVAVKEIDLNVASGELICLIGANGAGKTTTLKTIAGLLRARSGSIHYAGHEIGATPVHRLAQMGVSLVPEGRGVFGRLSVLENLQLGAYRRSVGEMAQDLARVYELFPRLQERRRQAAGTLSGGEQQMLAIGRALMNRPKLLLLDEPSMGLAPLMVEKIFETIQSVARSGVTLLLVEQNAKLALDIADRGYVLESGRVRLADTAANLKRDANIRSVYLGEPIA